MKTIDTVLELKKWAVVGATDNKEKFGYKIYKCMKDAGYNVYPVNPGVEEVEGDKCYPNLESLPIKPDAVDVVVAPRVGVQIMHQCAQLGITTAWLQPGANGDSVIEAGKQLGLNVIHDACIMVEIRHRKGQ